MFNKLYNFIMLMMIVIGFQACSGDDPVSGGTNPEPDLVGCEATDFYDWTDFTFETSLDGGATTWLGFELDETTLFSINLNQAGFHCAIFEECAGELGSPPPLYSFQTNGNGIEVGIVTAGTYYLEITNTRPGRLDFEFSISLNDIVYGCMDDDAINYNENANVDDATCEYNDCNTEWYTSNYGDMVLDCDGNCAPISWVGDGYCDDGAYGIFENEEQYNNWLDCQDAGGDDCNQYLILINLWCEEHNFDEGDCEIIVEECAAGEILDCNGNCAPANWVGDGFCDDGSWSHNGNDIYFNCEEFNNDEGDCDGQGRTTQERTLPNGKVRIQ